MRSIRLSLLVYFVLLVCASLGVASVLVYSIVQSTLRDKEKAASDLVRTQFNERCQEARSNLDERLLATARSLAGRVRPHIRSSRDYAFHLHGLGLLSSMLTPQADLGMPHLLWIAQSGRLRQRGWPPIITPLQFHLWRHDMVELRIGDEVELPEDQKFPRISWLIQTNRWGPSLPPRGELTLPDAYKFASESRLTWEWDDCKLKEGLPVRRLRFRSLLTLREDGPQPTPRPPNTPRKGSEPRGPPPPRFSYAAPKPAIIIQCAASLRELQETLEPFRVQRDEDLQRLRAETSDALVRQRNWLLLISGLTFAATVLGCVGLVWLGLLPLHRLSDAVSEISPRNFTLSLGKHPLPAELQPIVHRLNDTLDLLRRAFAREKQATADISHELRTPLAALLTTIELALRRTRSVEQYREMLQECHGSASHMHQIVERLLTLARLDAGVDRLRMHQIDVSELAQQCVVAVRPLAEARGLHLTMVTEQLADAEAVLKTDPDKLREVLNNLLHNAIQYNRPSGRIDLAVGRHNGSVQVEIRDTGIGIAPEARERIFERFYRADPSRACDGMNAGLGLAIVKEYVDLMGGRISVESVVGQGSTFRVELPVEVPTSAA